MKFSRKEKLFLILLHGGVDVNIQSKIFYT